MPTFCTEENHKAKPLKLNASYRGMMTGGTATCVSSLTTSNVWKRFDTDTPPHQNGESHSGPVNSARGRGRMEETSASHFIVNSARTSSTSSSSLISANELARLRPTSGSSVSGRPVVKDNTWMPASWWMTTAFGHLTCSWRLWGCIPPNDCPMMCSWSSPMTSDSGARVGWVSSAKPRSLLTTWVRRSSAKSNRVSSMLCHAWGYKHKQTYSVM